MPTTKVRLRNTSLLFLLYLECSLCTSIVSDTVAGCFAIYILYYPDYIQDYVWKSEPVGKNVFYDVHRALYDARADFSGDDSQAPSIAPTMVQTFSQTFSQTLPMPDPEDYTVIVPASIEYDFFAGTMLREFTEAELDGLLDKLACFIESF